MQALMRAPLSAPLEPRQQALVRYAVKLTAEPWAMVAGDVAELRAAGLDDRTILDVNLVCGYYAFVNRLAQGLGVELEPSRAEEP